MSSYGNPNNVQVSIIYESGENGKLIGIADNSGTQVLWYEYNATGMLSSVRDMSGRRVQYFYDASGRLSKVVDLQGNESLYYYDSEGRITSKQDAAGRTYNVAYNNYGFVKSVTDERGIGTFFDYAYDAGKQQRYSSVKYSSGKIIERWYDRFTENIRTDVNGRTIEKVTRDGRNKIFTDASGNKTYKEYDEWGNLTKQTNPDGTTLTNEYERRFNRLIQEVNERGVITKYEHDSSGNMLRKIEAFGTVTERVTEYTYETGGNPLSVKRVGDSRTLDATTSRTYDSSDNMVSETDPEGNTTQFTYDAMGNLLTRRDARSKVWTYSYDNMGRLVSATDPLNHSASYEYDAVGNKTKEIDPEGKVKTYEFDGNKRLTKMTDASGNVTQSFYNTDGKLIKQIDQEGRSITYEYDLDGRLMKTTDGNGNEIATEYNDAAGSSCTSCSGSSNGQGQPSRIVYPTFSKTYAYDSRGRKTQERDVLSDTEAYSAQFAYDGAGYLISQTDKENRTTAYQYDELGRRVKVINPLMGVTEYTYDNRDNVIALKDAKGNTTTFEYDRNNRLTKETRPLGQATTYQYDPVGNLIRKIDAKGQKTEYEYDDAGSLTKTIYFATVTDTTPVKTVTFTYDRAGNLTTYDDGTTSATFTYDDAYRKLLEAVNYGTFELTYSYSYHKNGLKKSLTMPDGTTYDYTYDNNNQVSLISIPGVGSMTYNKYKWNMPETITLPGGIRRDNTYDPVMQLKSLTVKGPVQNQLMSYNYEYSPVGNVTAKKTEQGPYAYQYDEQYRLTGATNPVASNESYTYDAVGNRLTSSDMQGSWSYNTNNELLGYGNVSYDYDKNGNVIQKTDKASTTALTYDVNNRLIQIRNPQSAIYNYYYDPFGKRLGKEVNGVRTHYFYSDEGLVAEYDASGKEIKAYGYAPSSAWTTNPLFQKIATNYYWYQNDHLGTPQKIVDASGKVAWSATADAFGNTQIQVSEIENNLRFPGQYYDQETGLHYNYHRYYDPTAGRYLTPDPIGMEGGLYPFLYAEGNPVIRMDPFGLFPNHGHLSDAGFYNEKCRTLSSEAANVSWRVDYMEGSQAPENAHWHAMSNGRADESVESARGRTEKYINENLSKCNADGLGRALHAEQDKYAGGHRGYQPWYGRNNWEHIWNDMTGGGETEAVIASIKIIKRFKEMCSCACGN
jgi:RHS repeat-associated protein